MKIVIVNDSIVSLENVRRVNKKESNNKKEEHSIRITYCDGESEWIYFDYADKEYFEAIFNGIGSKLAEREG